jgi:quercetin dioxygenase-like cupin family protein
LPHGLMGQFGTMAPGRLAIFKLLCDQTGGSIAIFEEVLPPGSGTPLHIHSGEFIVRFGTETKPAGEGAWIFIPRGLLHGWRNIGDADGRAFFIFTPGGGAKTVEEMRFLGKFARDIDPADRDEIWTRNGTEFVTQDW